MPFRPRYCGAQAVCVSDSLRNLLFAYFASFSRLINTSVRDNAGDTKQWTSMESPKMEEEDDEMIPVPGMEAEFIPVPGSGVSKT